METLKQRYERAYFYDMKGRPVTLKDAERMLGQDRHVGDTYLFQNGRHLRVSTVLLGVDYGWGDGPPVIFETMIFQKEHADPSLDGYQLRYRTKREAELGHHRVVRMVRELLRRKPLIRKGGKP